MSKYYPDTSHYHPVKDWNKIKSNCPFVITKATQGTSFVDSMLKSFVKECESRKIPYWLFVYLNKGSEVAQTKFLVSTCKDLIGDCFVGYVLDVEAGNTAGNVQSALDYLATTGYKMMIYTMYSEYASYRTVITNRPSNCAWWEARYGKNDGNYSSAYPCHSGVDLHQYTENGTCPGFADGDKLDLNRITGNGKTESWFMNPKEETASTQRVTGVNYFSTLKNSSVTTIKKFLNNRGYKAGKHNLELIASANSESDDIRDALFAVAKTGKLIKPSGLVKTDGSKFITTGTTYFSKLTNSSVKNIGTMLKNRGYKKSKANIRRVAKANCQNSTVKKGMFSLAKKGLLIKPDGLNKK